MLSYWLTKPNAELNISKVLKFIIIILSPKREDTVILKVAAKNFTVAQKIFYCQALDI